MFTLLLEVLGTVEVENKVVLQEFVAKEILSLAKRAEQTKGYERKKDPDTLKLDVLSSLTDENKVIADILSDLITGYPEVTSAKIASRLTALIKDGVACKEEIKDGAKRVMSYRLV